MTFRAPVIASIIAAGLSLAQPAGAEPAPARDGPLLTIGGNVAEPNEKGVVVLDLPAIEALGSATIETTTDWEWHEGRQQTFGGVPLLSVLDAAGAAGDSVTVTAADAYSVTIPRDDLARHAAMLATTLNGEALTEESFGPLWLVFPYDEIIDPAERTLYTDRSVWSVVEIVVR